MIKCFYLLKFKFLKMAEVRIEKSEDFEKALKLFKYQCRRERILERFREKQFYIKPSEKRRRNVKKRKRHRRKG